MNDLINIIPNPDPLPVASVWFQILSHLTYYFHLISIGIMFTVAVSMTLGFFRGGKRPEWMAFGREMGYILPFAIAFAVNLGVAPLLFLQVLYGNFFYTASILIGTHWILLIVIIIIGYYSAYWISFRKSGINGSMKPLSLLVPLILAWTAFLLVNVNTLMLRPEKWISYFSHPGGFHLNLGDTTMLPRYTFFIFLLLGIGGLSIAMYSRFRHGKEASAPWVAYGSSLSGFALFLTIPSWLLYLSSLPDRIRGAFMTENLFWTSMMILFLAGVVFSAYMALKRKPAPASLILSADLILFVIIRGQIRRLFLEPFSEKFSVIGANTQYLILLLFLVILTVGLGLVFWMLRKTWKELKIPGDGS